MFENRLISHWMIEMFLFFLFQRKELEDFKERMRVRKEQRMLKTFAVDSEN